MPGPIPFPDADQGKPPQLWVQSPVGGINTHSKRPAIDDQEFSWLQNYIPLGDGNLRTAWSNSAPIFTAVGKSIIYYYFFNIATVQQCAVFFSDGTAIQINPVTFATVTITSTPNFFYIGTSLPQAAQWNANGIIIVCESQNPNGYFAWDGTTLFTPGVTAPTWLTNGVVASMPSGVHGNAIEIYQNRAWVTTPPEPGNIPSTISNSGPGNGATFAPSNGGNTVPQQDASLRASFTAIKQINGFLYVFGDSNVSVISNVQQSGSTVTYSNQNVDPQIGTSWPQSVQVFSGTNAGTALMFANPQGIFVLLGGYCLKVSDDLDQLFANADFTVTPTAAVVILFGVKFYCLLLKTRDYLGNVTTVMCMTAGNAKQNGQLRWFLCSQVNPQTIIGTNEVNSNLQCWSTDGTNLFQCFTTPSSSLVKTYQSRLFPGRSIAEYIIFKKLYRYFLLGVDNAGSGVTISGTIDNETSAQNTVSLNSATSSVINFVNNSGGVIIFVNGSSQPIFFTVQSVVVPMSDVRGYGLLIGATMTSSSVDYTLIAITMLYSYDAPYGG